MREESLTIVGCGYTGLRLARLCKAAGIAVRGTVRSDAARSALQAEGIPAQILDLDHHVGPCSDTAGPQVYMVPPPASGDRDPRVEAWLTSLTSSPSCIVYLSTTAVYGDRQGAVVSEDSEPRPESDRGRRRLDAERRILAYGARTSTRVRILRVPGIYGPGRLPLDRIANGSPVPAADETGPGNRIHVDDLAAACLAAIHYRGSLQVFNVGDGEYASMGEYFLRVARLAGLQAPPQLPLAELLEKVSPAMRSFLIESRRVDVSRMRDELGFRPRYADLDEGIIASLAEEEASR